MLSQSGATANAYLYTGQQYDALTGLYSLRARYYAPSDGRFLSPDAYPYTFANPIERNRYVYAANSPVNAIDPSGQQAFAEYSMANENSEEKGAPAAAETGSAVEDAIAAQDAVFEREAANDLFRSARFWTKSGRPQNITVGKGHYVVNGEMRALAGTNQSESAFHLKLINENLRPLIPEDTTWLGGTQGTLHFEQLVVEFGKTLPRGSQIVVGVANKICTGTCIPMIQELGGQQVAGGVWRIVLENGVKIFILGR